MDQYAENGEFGVLRPAVAWVAQRGGVTHAVDARIPALLAEVARRGTLTAAARALAIPYRTAWSLVEGAAADIGAPLLALTRGRGATLTSAGSRLLAAHEALAGVVGAVAPLRIEAAARAVRPAPPPPLRIAASHDIALAQLRDRWRLAHGIVVAFHGSAESLDAYRAGTVDLAGFHVDARARRSDPLLARLDPARDAVIAFLRREQGLIVPKGNPRRVRSLAQAAARGLVLVNRQPGSGTRLLLDRLLARERVDPRSLRGYTQEEFTHAAVAATIAAGRADVGLGIAAAAAQFGLAFVPLVTERYCFAVRRPALRTPRMLAFRRLLADEATRAVVAPLPGYALDRPGEVD